MKLFRSYDQPGKGVEKDAPKGSAFARFFAVFFRKLSKLMQVNLLYLLFMLPVLALCVVLFILPVQRYDISLNMGIVTYNVPIWNMYVVTVPLIFGGPALAGLTYITRNFAREEHAFVWSDFIGAVKTNWKPFLLHSLLTYCIYVPLSLADIYYYASISESWGYVLPFFLCSIFTLVLVFAQYYVPVMIVTFDLKLRQIYKNALIFSVLGFGRNVIFTAVLAGMIFLLYKALTFTTLTVLLAAAFFLLLLFAFVSFTQCYCTYPAVDKYLMKPYYEQQKKEQEEVEKLAQQYPKDELDELERKSAYVYVDGHLVKRDDPNEKEE